MKINQNLDPTPIGKSSKSASSAKAAEAKGSEEASSSGELAKLSKKSNELSVAPFDSAKVEQIKQSIRDNGGKLEVNAKAVAAGVIQSAKELLGRA
jgi:flagellar biosynthesis anti-sigma factor FlgM